MKTIYQCDFCPGTSTDAVGMVIHEMDCLFNPVNRGCMTCKNYREDIFGDEVDVSCKKNIKTDRFEADCDGWEKKA